MKKKDKDKVREENIEKIQEEFEKRKKLPKQEKTRISKKIFKNILILFIILVYLYLLQIGEDNIQTESYILILKVCSALLICATVVMFEISYKCNKNEVILHSIEVLVLSFYTLFLISAYSLYYGQFYKVIQVAMISATVYYVIKSLIIWRIYKREYLKSLNDIKTIVAKR